MLHTCAKLNHSYKATNRGRKCLNVATPEFTACSHWWGCFTSIQPVVTHIRLTKN